MLEVGIVVVESAVLDCKSKARGRQRMHTGGGPLAIGLLCLVSMSEAGQGRERRFRTFRANRLSGCASNPACLAPCLPQLPALDNSQPLVHIRLFCRHGPHLKLEHSPWQRLRAPLSLVPPDSRRSVVLTVSPLTSRPRNEERSSSTRTSLSGGVLRPFTFRRTTGRRSVVQRRSVEDGSADRIEGVCGCDIGRTRRYLRGPVDLHAGGACRICSSHRRHPYGDRLQQGRVSEVRTTQPPPFRFTRPPNRLSLYTDVIAARHSGSPGDVWGRLSRCLKSVQGAYPKYPIPSKTEAPCPIPRPRPLRFAQD
ncbi:hypothetical protein LXA43DRAFT_512910 [Ganoderma leucocontextum]|nr:hypothetical protein LXA43DRAFT_512910 [Ganoderma leucocontextum]